MRISARAWRRLAAAVVMPGAALGTLAGFSAAPAMASTAQVQQGSPIETFQAYAPGVGNEISIYANGVFNDSGYLDVYQLFNGGGEYTLYLRHGNLYVDAYNFSGSPSINYQACSETYTAHFTYDVDGGTGAYQYAEGWGYATARISVLLRRNGLTCDTNQPRYNTLTATLHASGPFAFF